MKLGLYFNLCNPTTAAERPSVLFGHTLDLIADADRAGLGSVWLSEHHLRQDGYLPQPLTLAAAVAARTERVRIGTSVLILPLRHTLDVAEQASVVDLVSEGRLELGVSPGYVREEFSAFGADHAARNRTMWSQIGQLRELWRDGVRPQPVQDEAPIWLGAKGPKNIARAGREGLGLLRVGRSYVAPYLDGLAAGGHEVGAVGRMAGPVNIFLSDDPERDWPQVGRAVAHQWGNYAAMGGGAAGTDIAERMRAAGVVEDPMAGFALLTPQDAASAIRTAVGDGPIAHVYVWGRLPGLESGLVERNVQLAVTELAPLLAEHPMP